MKDEENLDEQGNLKIEIQTELNNEYYASLIVGWDNISMGENQLEYNFENVKKLMENDIARKFVITKVSGMGKLPID